MSTKIRKARASSKDTILQAAIHLAIRHGLRNFARINVAQAVCVAEATVSFHFGTMADLRREVVRHAIEHDIAQIINDIRADRNRAELYGKLSNELRQKITALIAA
jgi:AcrR family transcriptional regulator